MKTVTGTPVFAYDQIGSMKDDLDVVIICGGSATDLPWMTPELAAQFNVIDSFDNHANIPEHFANVDAAASAAGKVGIISCGWDPGYFSLARILADSALPEGDSYTFWGRGVSQGHSDAIRRIEGVKDARQYTVPVEAAVESVRNNEHPEFTARQMHLRECWVVAEEGADKAAIEEAIKTMPNYFEPYDTTVTFITQDELNIATESSNPPLAIIRFWCAKEAVSKALGTGIRYSPRELNVTGYRAETGQLVVRLNGGWVQAFKNFKGRDIEVSTRVLRDHALAFCLIPAALFADAND